MPRLLSGVNMETTIEREGDIGETKDIPSAVLS